MSNTETRQKRGSIWTSFAGVLFGALVATMAFVLLSLWITDREAALRNAEISAPLPTIDLPPGSLPEVTQPPAP